MAKKQSDNEFIEDKKEIVPGYNPPPEIRKRMVALSKRVKAMEAKKKELAINDKTARMDVLFTPHMVAMDRESFDQDFVDFDDRRLLNFSDNQRKSKPLAFQKITTAQATLVRENVKVKARAEKEEFANVDLIVAKTYEENWRANKSSRELKRVLKDAALYGIGYLRRYHKRVWRILHEPIDKDEEGNIVYSKRRNFLINDVVTERMSPRDVLLDPESLGPSDAKDNMLTYRYEEAEFKRQFPKDIFPNAEFVKAGQRASFQEIDADGDRIKDRQTSKDVAEKIIIEILESITGDYKETWANKIFISRQILPGHQLSISGMKWYEDRANYDAIGMGQILELYQPLVDDVLNSSNERLRQLVRPIRVMGNDVKAADDSDWIWEAGAEFRVTGNLDEMKWDRPPAMTDAEVKDRELLSEEIDIAVGIPKLLEGLDTSDTAFQAAQNREEALKRLSLPLGNLKDMIEDDANKAFRLFKDVYSVPESVDILQIDSSEFVEAKQILQQDPADERFVDMGDGTIARRRFRQMKLGLAKEMKRDTVSGEGIDTGKVIDSEEQEFWEMIPAHFNWEGHIEVLALSFLPVSKVIEDNKKRERAEFLLGVPTVDPETGQPLLVDSAGRAHTIDKVKVLKEMIESSDGDPDKFITPVEQPEQMTPAASPETASPLKKTRPLSTTREDMGKASPVVRQTNQQGRLATAIPGV